MLKYRDVLTKRAADLSALSTEELQSRLGRKPNRVSSTAISGAIAMPLATAFMRSLDSRPDKVGFGEMSANAAGGYVIGDLIDKFYDWKERRKMKKELERRLAAGPKA